MTSLYGRPVKKKPAPRSTHGKSTLFLQDINASMEICPSLSLEVDTGHRTTIYIQQQTHNYTGD